MQAKSLTADEQRSWTAFMQMQEVLRSRIEQRLLAHSHLSHAEYTILAVLASASEQRMRLTELGASVGWERSRLHHQLTRMCKRGLVDRGPMRDAEDGRASEARLTERGAKAIREAWPHHLLDVRELVIDVLDHEQLRQLGQISSVILAALQAQPDK